MRKRGAVLALLLALWSSADARLHGGVVGAVTTYFGATLPTLPQTTPVRTFSLPSCGSTNNGSCYTPSNNTQAQADINAAASASGSGGDVIELTAGTNYGTLVLAAHGTTHGTIYIVSTQIPELGGSLPASGTRVGPSNVSNMPVLSGSGSYIISDNGATSTQASNYRLIGLAVEGSYTSGQADGVVGMISVGMSVTNTLPSNITVDRCYVLGDATNGARRGISIAGNNVAVFDSYVTNIFDVGNADNQAFANWSGGTGYILDNNYFAAAGESVLFGGADPAIVGISPASDITISNNNIFKGTTLATPSVGKNASELKCAVRVLFTHNHIEAVWGSQSEGIAITVRNQSGANTQSQIEDITVTNNRFWNAIQPGMGFINVSGQDTPSSGSGYSQPTHRILIRNNIWLGTNTTNGGGSQMMLVGIPTDANQQPSDLIVDHNTFVYPSGAQSNWLYWTGALASTGYGWKNVVFSNNIMDVPTPNGVHDDSGDGTWTAMIANYMTSAAAINNAALSPNGLPSGNFTPANEAAIDFNATGVTAEYPGTVGYILTSMSPYYQAGVTGANLPYTSGGTSDGTDIGANISQVAQ